MKELKKILKEKPAYANIYVMSKKGPTKLIELKSTEEIQHTLKAEELKMLALAYYDDLSKRFPNERIVGFTIPSLEISYAEAKQHIARDTKLGKDLVQRYQEFVTFVLKRISGELYW